MAIQVQRRRGSTADHTAFTGVAGEITVDTTKQTAVVHDGVTAGGHPLAREVDPTFYGKVGIGSTSFGPTVMVQSANTFDINDSSTTAGVHVMGNGVGGIGAYGGALTLSQTGGSTRPGAGIASVQSSADPDICGLAFLVHGGSVSSNQLQQAVTVNSDRSMTCTNTVSAVTQLRIKVANDSTDIAAILRKDASGFYLLFTDDGNADGSYNVMRPFTVSDVTGNSGFGTQHLSTVRVFIEGAGNTGGTYSLICRNIDGTTGLFVDNTGLVGTRALQTEKTSVTAPAGSDGNVYSGTYTPVLTSITNLAALTAFSCVYLRVGSTVTVSGIFNADVTATGAFSFEMSAPVTTSFGNAYKAGGAFSESGSGASWGAITSKTGTNVLKFAGQSPVTTANQGFSFDFTYRLD